MKCQLCDREMDSLTVHHLIPRQAVKRKKAEAGPTADICHACHRQIHKLFDNNYLALHLNTIDKLKSEPNMQRFLAWVSKQDPHKRIKVARSKF